MYKVEVIFNLDNNRNFERFCEIDGDEFQDILGKYDARVEKHKGSRFRVMCTEEVVEKLANDLYREFDISLEVGPESVATKLAKKLRWEGD